MSHLIRWLLVAFVIAGCSPTSSTQLYENATSCISLEKPDTWKLAYYERSGNIVMVNKKGIWSTDSARVETLGNACPPPVDFTPEEGVRADIHRIGL